MKLSAFNKVTGVGYVQNAKLSPLNSGKKVLRLTVKDELTGNVCYASFFERSVIKYGGEEITITQLKNRFMTEDDKPKHVLVRFTGTVEERQYTNAHGRSISDTTPIISFIDPETDESKQGFIFNFTGIVDNMRDIEDGNAVKIRLGILKKDRDGRFNSLCYNTLVARGDTKEKLENKDVEKGSQITVGGDIFNLIQRDKYGISSNENPIKENRIMSIGAVRPCDDIDDYENVYVRIKKGLDPIFDEVPDEPVDDFTDDDADF